MKNRPPGNYRCVSDFLLSLRISQNPFTLCISGLQGFLNRREDILLSFYKLQFILGSHFMPCFYLFLIMHFFVRLQSGKRRIKMRSFRTSSFLILFFLWLLSQSYNCQDMSELRIQFSEVPVICLLHYGKSATVNSLSKSNYCVVLLSHDFGLHQ